MLKVEQNAVGILEVVHRQWDKTVGHKHANCKGSQGLWKANLPNLSESMESMFRKWDLISKKT